jgi:hypothetical protein
LFLFRDAKEQFKEQSEEATEQKHKAAEYKRRAEKWRIQNLDKEKILEQVRGILSHYLIHFTFSAQT